MARFLRWHFASSLTGGLREGWINPDHIVALGAEASATREVTRVVVQGGPKGTFTVFVPYEVARLAALLSSAEDLPEPGPWPFPTTTGGA